MLKGITMMMMIVLLMKACIESSRDISLSSLLFLLGFLRRVFTATFTTITFIPTFIYILLRVVSIDDGLVSST